jgi:D-alanyl-D-alanine carboxypeptidase (penicillin-binding protein 5/6)
LAEAAAGDESAFAKLMNARAEKLGMRDSRFINATGLPMKKGLSQYSTAYDLALLIRAASRDRRIDHALEQTEWALKGSDGRVITLKTHNKMLWKSPGLVKGKTGWTIASRHTFAGTNFGPDKSIAFAMLSSSKPWADIERLATFGMSLKPRRWFFF